MSWSWMDLHTDANMTADLSHELAGIRYALDRSAIVAVTDHRGDILHVNDRFCEISGYQRSELLGQNHRLINSGYHSGAFFQDMWRTITSGQVWEGEIRNRTKNGAIYWVHTTIVPLLDRGGRPHQYVSIRFEITQRKIFEEQLRDYSRRLELSNRELQDFAGVAAHDLQEPLRKIVSFADRLQGRLGETATAEVTGYLDRMVKATRRMQSLIEDLLSYSRVNSRAKPFQEVDLREVLDGVLFDIERALEDSGAQVLVPDRLPTLNGDPVQLRQLFQNLLTNAVKFRKEDRPVEVRLDAEVVDGFVVVRVTDNGIGFDDRYSEKIFEVCQRLHSKDRYPGTGMGLAICRKIAERHGGSIHGFGRPGAGATFVVRLPQAAGGHGER